MPSVTINFSPAVANRVSLGLQLALHLDNPATAADIKQYIIRNLKSGILAGEQEAAEMVARENINEIDFT